MFWVDLTKVDFSESSGVVKKLDLGPNQANTFSGVVNGQFKDSPPFKFLGL